MSRSRNEPDAPRFRVGDKVRVKYGVIDPDYPDIPMGGWTGDITEVEQAPGRDTYEIRWDKRTLEGMHPVYRKRCERDSLELENMHLRRRGPRTRRRQANPDRATDEDRDEAALGRLPRRSSADGLRPDPRRPASAGGPEDTPDLSPLPRRRSFRFPFRASWKVYGFAMTVHRLLGPREYDLEEEAGLLCEIRCSQGTFEIPLSELDDVENCKLVEDYGYWFWNWN